MAWEQVEARTSESTSLSASYLAFMPLAMLIAASGIVQGTSILIIGAMIVGPDFGPVAGTSVAAVEGRGGPAARSLLALVAGFCFGFAVTAVVFYLLRTAGLVDPTLVESAGRLTRAVHRVTVDRQDVADRADRHPGAGGGHGGDRRRMRRSPGS